MVQQLYYNKPVGAWEIRIHPMLGVNHLEPQPRRIAFFQLTVPQQSPSGMVAVPTYHAKCSQPRCLRLCCRIDRLGGSLASRSLERQNLKLATACPLHIPEIAQKPPFFVNFKLDNFHPSWLVDLSSGNQRLPRKSPSSMICALK